MGPVTGPETESPSLLQPPAPEGHLRRPGGPNFASSESQVPRDFCQAEQLPPHLLAALGPLTQLGGTLQKLPQGPRDSPAGGGGAVQMRDPNSRCHPADNPQPSQRWLPASPHSTDCCNTPTPRRVTPSLLTSRTRALGTARAGTRTQRPGSWR